MFPEYDEFNDHAKIFVFNLKLINNHICNAGSRAFISFQIYRSSLSARQVYSICLNYKGARNLHLFGTDPGTLANLFCLLQVFSALAIVMNDMYSM
jgi:hypothetical protein